MTELLKTRMMVCARGVEIIVEDLFSRADCGNAEAERALEKLRDAFETATSVLGGRVLFAREDKLYAAYDALLILDRAVAGHAEYPPELLRSIARQAVEDCRALGLDPPDISFFTG